MKIEASVAENRVRILRVTDIWMSKLDPEPQFDDAAHQVSYHVTIVEGPQYRMGEMVITGLSVDAEKRLRRAWLIAPGQVFDDGYFRTDREGVGQAQPRTFLGKCPSITPSSDIGSARQPRQHTVDVLLDFK